MDGFERQPAPIRLTPPDDSHLTCTHTHICMPGDDLLVSARTPGIFLQGLSVHGNGGMQLSDSQLPSSVVEAAYRCVCLSGASRDEQARRAVGALISVCAGVWVSSLEHST